MPWPAFKLNDGHTIPGVAFGSAGHAEDVTPDVIDTAIDVGFNHIDTAQMYRNEAGVGKGLKQSALPRSDLYLTTKWSGWAPIQQSIHESLEKLGVEDVDLYLIHNPRITGGDIEGKWREFEQVHKDGLAKSIGVSNYSIDDLKRVLAIAQIKPAVNQIILNPHVYQSTIPLLEFMDKHNILAEGYSPLKPLRDGSSPQLVQLVEDVAKAHGVKAEQVLLAWAKAKGVLPITTSSNRDRAASYIAAGDLDLSHDDIKAIDDAGAQGYRRAERLKTAGTLARVALAIAVGYYIKSLFTA